MDRNRKAEQSITYNLKSLLEFTCPSPGRESPEINVRGTYFARINQPSLNNNSESVGFIKNMY
jgi:hypothetical protein